MDKELSSQNFIKKITKPLVKNWLLIYITFTALTLLNKYKFYSEFEIDIVNYISIAELPTLMFGEQLRIFERLGLNFVIYMWGIIITNYVIGLIFKLRQKIKKLKESPAPPKFSLGIIFLGCFTVFIVESQFTPQIGIISFFEFFIFTFFFSLISERVKNNYQTVIAFGIIVFILFNLGGSERAGLIKKGCKRVEISLFDNSQLMTGAKIKYVGETNDYIFIYDSCDSTSITIRRDNVTSMKYWTKTKLEANPIIELLTNPYLVN